MSGKIWQKVFFQKKICPKFGKKFFLLKKNLSVKKNWENFLSRKNIRETIFFGRKFNENLGKKDFRRKVCRNFGKKLFSKKNLFSQIFVKFFQKKFFPQIFDKFLSKKNISQIFFRQIFTSFFFSKFSTNLKLSEKN